MVNFLTTITLPAMCDAEKINGITAGISLFVMAVATGFSYGYVFTEIVVDSAGGTLRNLIA